MTTPASEPGERRPRTDPPTLLDRPPGDRYLVTDRAAVAAGPGRSDALIVPLGLIVGGALAFTVLGGIVDVTAGLVIIAAFLGWLTGRLVSPPRRAALVAVIAVSVGFLGIWLFGRIEGGVLDPVAYLLEVEGPIVVAATLIAGAGLAAAAAR